MPPSTKKRRGRTVKSKKPAKPAEIPAELPDSSPSRPAKRRKKVEMSTPEPEPQHESTPEPEPEPVQLPKSRAELQMNDEELMNAIVNTLTLPPREVQVTRDHANEKHEKQSSVSAFAKLAGNGWTYFIKKTKNYIGRPPDATLSHASTEGLPGGPQPDAGAAEQAGIDIDLGPNKMVSRNHACIFYDDDTENWSILVFGRNGVRINTTRVEPRYKMSLFSGTVIEIAGVEMMFSLPVESGSLGIHKKYLERANLIAKVEDGYEDNEGDDDDGEVATADNTLYRPSPSTAAMPSARTPNGGPLPIAPAPPGFQRPGTPSNSFTKTPFSTGKSPYAGSTMLMNSEDVDLSLDANGHIKPSYSYAQLISQAILKVPGEEMIALSHIYRYITSNYAYYRHQDPKGWQNSIRHNLSLNDAFEKKDRPTTEPGKGSKWTFRPHKRDEMVANAYKNGRGGHRGSPGSSGGSLRNAKEGSSRVTKRATTSKSISPTPTKKRSTSPTNQQTPTRESKHSERLQDEPLGDGSPLPRLDRPQKNVMGIFDNVPASPPPVSSSYLPEEGSAFVTPAPRKVHPQFGPASTAQRPSQVMQVTSSPAPFWRYLDANTPLTSNVFDSSPMKGPSASGVPPSSSPAPARGSSAASPSRNAGSGKAQKTIEEEVEDEDQGFDLTRGFQSIGSFHSAPTNAVSIASPLNARS